MLKPAEAKAVPDNYRDRALSDQCKTYGLLLFMAKITFTGLWGRGQCFCSWPYAVTRWRLVYCSVWRKEDMNTAAPVAEYYRYA